MLPLRLSVDIRRHAIAAFAAVACIATPAFAQFYEKVDLAKASESTLVEALTVPGNNFGGRVATFAGAGDPSMSVLFRAMTKSGDPRVRVYGVLGAALNSDKGIDPELMTGLQSEDERAAVIREANVSGILRKSPASAILAQGKFTDAGILALVGEIDRRGESWDPALVLPITTSKDAIAAGFASLLLRDGNGKDPANAAPWDAFRARLTAMSQAERDMVLRALIEAVTMFELRSATTPLMELASAPECREEVRVSSVGMCLRLDTPKGVAAWQERVTANRSQLALMRAGMQLLASYDRGVPPTAFDAIRNGTPILDGIADAGSALASGKEAAPALIGLLELGNPTCAEWALVRASELPVDRAAPVWKHILAKLDEADASKRPPASLVTGVARELMKSEPATVKAMLDGFKDQPDLQLAAMVGIADSRVPAAVDIARAHRGHLPRAAEGIAALILARNGATLNEDDLRVLGRAAAGGGDMDPERGLQAAWYCIRAGKKDEEVANRIASSTARSADAGTR